MYAEAGFHVGRQMRFPEQWASVGQGVGGEHESLFFPKLAILTTIPAAPAAVFSDSVSGYQAPLMRRSRKQVAPIEEDDGRTSPSANGSRPGTKSRRAPTSI